jgi:teichuronic acid biosynthesis glycosyltransferase TuaG
MKKVSIITPNYNGEQFIEQASRFIIGQTHTNWEWIIVDDHSTDSSLIILDKLANSDQRIKVVRSEKNQGAAVARNTGIDNASGDYLAFLDCDDVWRDNKLEVQLNYIESQNAEFTYHHYRIINETGKVLKTQKIQKYIEQEELLLFNPFATSSIMIKTSVIKDNNIRFKTYLRRRQDYLFWYDAIGVSNKAMGIFEPLSDYRIFSKDSLSANKTKMAKIQWMILRKEFKLGLLSSVYNFIRYAIHGIKKYFL